MPEKSIAELTSVLRKAKQNPIYFHFAGGKTEEQHYLDLSIKRLPPRGLQLARKKAGNKPIGGKVHIDGKRIIFETIHPFPSKYELLLMKFLRKLKMAGMKVVIGPPGVGNEDDKKK